MEFQTISIVGKVIFCCLCKVRVLLRVTHYCAKNTLQAKQFTLHD